MNEKMNNIIISLHHIIIMEILFHYIKSLPNERMNEIQARYIFKQLIHAVHYMHSHGISHRDLSMENIMIHQGTSGLEAYIIDFGVAAINPAGPNATKFPYPGSNSSIENPGKIGYVSPELLSDSPWDAYANDCFSIGVILHNIVTGHS